jgi:DNA repair protein RadC
VHVHLLNAHYFCVTREDVCKGTVDETTAHPREIFRPVIVHAAAGFLLVHNHPCGDASPSSADINLTRRIRKGARLLGLTFLDHVIVGQPMEGHLGYYSFKDAGVV